MLMRILLWVYFALLLINLVGSAGRWYCGYSSGEPAAAWAVATYWYVLWWRK